MTTSERSAILSSGKLTGLKGGKDWHLTQFKKLRTSSRGVLLPAIEEHMLRKHVANDDEHRDRLHIHPSEMSKSDWCPRNSWYRLKGYPMGEPEKFSFYMENIFEEGHDIHHKWQMRLWDMGVLVGMFGCYVCEQGWFGVSPKECRHCGSALLYYNEVPLYREDLRIIGHADGEVLGNEDYPVGTGLIEVKSVSLGTLRFEAPDLHKEFEDGLRIDKLWDKIKRPFPSHLKQGMLYLYLRGLTRMTYIYEWKPSQVTKEFTLTYDADVVEPLIASCKDVVAHLDGDEPPARPGWALASESKGCKGCPFIGACWNGERHEPHSAATEQQHVGENRGRLIRRRPPPRG